MFNYCRVIPNISISCCLLLQSSLVANSNWQRNLVAQEDVFYTLDEAKEKPDQGPKKESVSVTVEEDSGEPEGILINFNNVSAAEFIRFISRISGKNFIFNEQELQFPITIISDEPTSVDNLLTALFHKLRIQGFTTIEQGNNIIVHSVAGENRISNVSSEDPATWKEKPSEMVTQVFYLNTLDPTKASEIIIPLTSAKAIVDPVEGTQQLIITDIASNLKEISALLQKIDAPNSGLVIGQYVVQRGQSESLINLAEEIMAPIAGEQTIKFVRFESQNTIFVISSPFIVEKTLSVLQNLDQAQGTTRIFDLKQMRFDPRRVTVTPQAIQPGPEAEGGDGRITPKNRGRWELDESGNWIFRPGELTPSENPPSGRWGLDPNDYWFFESGEGTSGGLEGAPDNLPEGSWIQDKDGNWIYQLRPGETFSAKELEREQFRADQLPLGFIERTKFFIHKLRFRKGEQILTALSSIAESLETAGANSDLVAAIDGIQWIETTNSLVVTGTPTAIDKVKELIEEIDVPLRQVFIEMLILETDVDDSLTYGVNWGSAHRGDGSASAQAFVAGASSIPSFLNPDSNPNANPAIATTGYNLGIIGRTVSKDGTEFRDLAALVKALHDNSRTNIVMNPKILTEDNNPAELFVGINTQYQTDSIANDEGSIVTTNYEYRDIGTTIKITPLLSNNDIITLEIEQESSNVASTQPTEGDLNQQSGGPTTRVNRTTTKVHVPDKYFLVMSGMMQDEVIDTRSTIPCLGGIPLIGAFGSSKNNQIAKRNLMLFIRPQIVDTAEELNTLTRRQQDIYHNRSRVKSGWKYEVDHMLDFLNIAEEPCLERCE